MLTRIHNMLVPLTKRLWELKGGHRLVRAIRSIYLSLGGNPVVLARLDGGASVWVDLRAHTEWHSFYLGRYDLFTMNACVIGLRDKEQFLDVGANIGMYAVFVGLQRQFTNSVFAFEPLNTNFERLTKNIAENALQAYVSAIKTGLSDKTENAELVLREDFEAGSGTGNASLAISDEADEGFTKTSIKLCMLDDLVDKLKLHNVGVIKVDIEGHEPEFLKGAKNLLNKQRPIIVSEINRQYFIWRNLNPDKIFPELLPQNYQILQVMDNKKLQLIDDLSTIGELENVVFCPTEKLGRYSDYM